MRHRDYRETDKKFSNLLKYYFSITRLLKIVGLQNRILLSRFIWYALQRLMSGVLSKPEKQTAYTEENDLYSIQYITIQYNALQYNTI